jgi:HD-like signal output (HDOD) protein
MTRTIGALVDALGGYDVPSFPKLTMRILSVLRDEETELADVGRALQWDPGLSVRLLRTVNSAAYAPRQPIANVEHAAAFLGRAQLEQLLLGLAVRDTLPREPAPGYDATRYWRAASRRASLAGMLAQRLHPARQAESFTMGLLSDMAVPVLAHARPDDYGPLLVAWQGAGDTCLSVLEQDALGWGHADVGELLGASWGLPDGLVDGIAHHHDDASVTVPAAVRLVGRLVDCEAEHGVEVLVEDAHGDYGIERDWSVEAVELASRQADQLVQAMS